MHKNRLWLFLLIFSASFVLWFSSKAAIELYHYSRLTSKTKSNSIEWTVHEKTSDKFFIQANFSFTTNNHARKGSTIFPDTLYRNRQSAQEAAGKIKDQSLTVWFAPEKENLATLYKKFPLKQCLYTAIVWGIMIYFILLGIYVGKQNEKRHS